jgi:hypothetical protein
MAIDSSNPTPGPIVLFGSGETSPSGQKIFNTIFSRMASGLPPNTPLQVAILETPAGFELNSAQVAGKVGEFIAHRLQNYNPLVSLVPARRRGTPFSPDNPDILVPLLEADVIFLGPGSPSYAVRQLSNSLAWQYLVARHRLGTGLALASAATIAIGACALPVYEIYKVGEEIHWKDGLNLLGAFGLPVVFVPHWDNNEGGENLDTSRCFMGRERFDLLVKMLPKGQTVVGIDEKTGLSINFHAQQCTVLGKGGVTLIRDGHEHHYTHHMVFDLQMLGEFRIQKPEMGLPPGVWDFVLNHVNQSEKISSPSSQVMRLVEERENARHRKDWENADNLRLEILNLGWQVRDTPQGPVLEEIK